MRRRLRLRPPVLTGRLAMRRRVVPGPLRWLLWAVVLACLVAAGLWTQQLWQQRTHMQQELEQLRWQVQEAQTQQALASNAPPPPAPKPEPEPGPTPDQLIQQSTIDSLAAQVRALQGENGRLKDELGFYENLLPAPGDGGIAIRNMTLARADDEHLAWQMLLMRPKRDAGVFKGELEWRITGLLEGKPWSAPAPKRRQSLELGRYLRLEGRLKIPKGLKAIRVTALVWEGKQERARHALALAQDKE
ncbi:DUF6776 family protein [Allofranklinella schreckenbergeri]|nr:DUF6776 family protein [Allofranklinella schreckenbergeri]